MEALPAIAGRFLDIVLPCPTSPRCRRCPGNRRRRPRGSRSRAPATPSGRGCALLKLGASDVVPLFGTGPRVGPKPLPRRGAVRGDAASCSGRTVAPSGPRRRSGRRGYGRPARDEAGHRAGLPSSASSTPPGPPCRRGRGGRHGRGDRALPRRAVAARADGLRAARQGTGGGALALMPADRVVCAQHSWLSPLPPEGASAILHRTPDRALEMATQQAVRSSTCPRRASSTGSSPSTRTPPRSRRPTAAGWPRRSGTSRRTHAARAADRLAGHARRRAL